MHKRELVVLALCAMLGGCSNGDFDRLTSYLPDERPQTAEQQVPSPPPQAEMPPALPPQAEMAPSPQPSPAPSQPLPADTSHAVVQSVEVAAPAATDWRADTASHCKLVSEQRRSDVAFMGYGEEMQQKEYDGTYASCMAWTGAHSE